ncbi:MAG: suppressor of fused domain protein, partial [Acidimicrobiia bacterium]|nr:suppressor of fused domain protein [Acidimicrobiia bacterium]
MFGSGPGWDAIDAALATRYGDRQPTCRFGPLTAEERERQPLTRIAAFLDDDNPLRPSWHLVTYGFTDLGSSPGSALSGHGFELTMRLA